MIIKNKTRIQNLDEWHTLAPPKSANSHWKKGRSAMEVARAWLEVKSPELPAEVKEVISNHSDFEDLILWEAEPEVEVKFDNHPSPPNIDLLVDAKDKVGGFTIGLEAKADETFSSYCKDILTEALERKIKNHNSKGIERVVDLAESIFTTKKKGLVKVTELRYQLLTGFAGTIAAAIQNKHERAIFLIHEFVTPLTTDYKREQNEKDLNNFLNRLTEGEINKLERDKIIGPVKISGNPLFEHVPNVYIGKAKRIINDINY